MIWLYIYIYILYFFQFFSIVRYYKLLITVPCCCCAQSLSHNQLCDPMNCSPPGSSIREIFPSKNTGVGCHFLLQGVFPNPGIKLTSLSSPTLAGGPFTTAPPGKVHNFLYYTVKPVFTFKYGSVYLLTPHI